MTTSRRATSPRLWNWPPNETRVSSQHEASLRLGLRPAGSGVDLAVVDVSAGRDIARRAIVSVRPEGVVRDLNRSAAGSAAERSKSGCDDRDLHPFRARR